MTGQGLAAEHGTERPTGARPFGRAFALEGLAPMGTPAYKARYRAEHRDELAAAAKAWREAHPDLVRACRRRHSEARRLASVAYRQTAAGREAMVRQRAKRIANEPVDETMG